MQYEVSQSAGHHRFVTSNSYKSSTGYTIYQLVCETVIMVGYSVYRGYTKQNCDLQKKKKGNGLHLPAYIQARFGPISPKSKHEKSDPQKKSTPCGNTANSVFRNYIFFGQLFFFYDAAKNNESFSFGCQRGRISNKEISSYLINDCDNICEFLFGNIQ